MRLARLALAYDANEDPRMPSLRVQLPLGNCPSIRPSKTGSLRTKIVDCLQISSCDTAAFINRGNPSILHSRATCAPIQRLSQTSTPVDEGNYTMTDSPAVQAPLDPREQPILDTILVIRDKLSLLKQDKSKYIKSQDVLGLYEEVIDQVHQLNVIRQEYSKPLEQNRGPLLAGSRRLGWHLADRILNSGQYIG